MKTKIILLSIFFSLLSCKSGIDSNSIIEKNGIVHEIEDSDWMYGTHTLNDEQGKLIYALRSSKLNLSNYNGDKVNIKGRKIDGYPVDGGPTYVNVESIKIIE